jgi:hypothetical protein
MGTHRAVVPREHKDRAAAVTERGRQQRRRPLHEAGGGSEGSRYRKRAALIGGTGTSMYARIYMYYTLCQQ